MKCFIRQMRLSTALSLIVVTIMSGCTMSQVAVRGAMPLMDGGFEAMNRENDLELARAAIPASVKMLEGMAIGDPTNAQLHIYAAQGLYGYTYGFVELEDPIRAVTLYTRCLSHAAEALKIEGLDVGLEHTALDGLQAALAETDSRHVPGLFWAASCMAKRVDMSRTDPEAIAQLARSAALMERVVTLDETYYYGGPHLFFGVYYGSRAPMFGGDYGKSKQHFDAARATVEGKLLISDVLRAEYLSRQTQDRQEFRSLLSTVISAPAAAFPEMAFANQVAKKRATYLLKKESEWF